MTRFAFAFAGFCLGALTIAIALITLSNSKFDLEGTRKEQRVGGVIALSHYLGISYNDAEVIHDSLR